MDRTAYVVLKNEFGGLGVCRVTVVRETEKSYILKTIPERPGIRVMAVEQESLFGHSASYLYATRVFAKGGSIFFSRDKALEECARIVAKRIVEVRTTLACLEEDQADLRRLIAVKELAMEIDELEGEELAAAVAAEIGMVYVADMWWTVDDSGVQHSTGMGKWGAKDYRPDRDIAQAWELDGEGWRWGTHERQAGLDVVVGWRLRGGFRSYTSCVLWADFPTKAQAYATACCRAYLKAKAAE